MDPSLFMSPNFPPLAAVAEIVIHEMNNEKDTKNKITFCPTFDAFFINYKYTAFINCEI